MKKVFVLFFSFICVVAYSQPNVALLEKINESVRNKNYVVAEKLTTKLLKKEKDNRMRAKFYSDLGTFQRKQGKNTKSEASYSAAIKCNPNSVSSYVNRAGLYESLGKFNEALSDYGSAIKINPTHEAALINRALLHKKQGNMDLAASDLETFLVKRPAHMAARSNLANIKKEQGKLKEALSDLTDLLVDYPREEIVFNNRADVYLKLEQFEHALIDAESAILLNEEYATAYVTKGEALLGLGRANKACAAFNKAISTGVRKEQLKDLMKDCK